MRKRLICLFLGVLIAAASCVCARAADLELSAPSAILMEKTTGEILYEQNSHEKLAPASVTKIMTLLLVMEALEDGRISWDDTVTTSAEAAAKGGSQIYLEENEQLPLTEMLKSVVVASANDCACALAEHIAGSESAFVSMMNERAQELGMTDTVYVNCTGLPVEGQHTTARDVALLSCQMCTHPEYFTYGAVWMDTLTHPSGRVTDLTNTNRLVRFYDGCDGLKTGSADDSKYCLSCTAEKNGMRLIAVVLGASASQTRFNEARAMLDYGFNGYKRVTVLQKGDRLGQKVKVHLGMQDEVDAAAGSGLSMLIKLGQEKQLSLEVELPEEVEAPLKAGDALGVLRVKLGDRVVARLAAVAAEDVGMPGLLEGFLRLLTNWR